ncbi:MAG: hypothetical protein O3A47_12020 [Chloroflexi bacterium]|nr:hypothetical protein [Chloroflexota bacterium]
MEQRWLVMHQSNLKRVVSEVDDKTGEKVFRYEGRPRRLHPSLIALIGDIIHNFRSALDHAAWSLVVSNGQTPTDRTQFPLCDVPAKFKRYGRSQIKGMSPQAKAFIKSQQPCYGDNHYRNDCLALLEKLDIVDKHRHLNVTIAATDGGFFNPGLPFRFSQNFVYSGPIDENAVLGRVPEGYHHVDFFPIYGIAFGQGSPGQDESVREYFSLADHIVEDIISTCERFA